MVHAIIAPTDLDEKTETHIKKQGHMHRHELVYATDPDGPLNAGDQNTAINIYLKHNAVRDFEFVDGHHVTPGVDYFARAINRARYKLRYGKGIAS
jgi:hypothetical protein